VYKILSKLVDECWRYSKRNQCHFWAWLKRPIFGVLDSKGSAETLVRRGGITNYYLIAYSFSNISAKNYQNRLMYWSYSVERHCRFFETQCTFVLLTCQWKNHFQHLHLNSCSQVHISIEIPWEWNPIPMHISSDDSWPHLFGGSQPKFARDIHTPRMVRSVELDF